MGKSKPMTKTDAARIQASAAKEGGTDQGFARRAQAAADKHEKK